MGGAFLGGDGEAFYGRGCLKMPRITPVDWKALERVFLGAGFQFARQEGSHRSTTKPVIARPVVIPAYDDVPVSIIRTNLKTAGISRDDYFRLLGE